MTRLKKRIRIVMLILFIVLILILGGIWFATNPSNYPYPDAVSLSAVDQKIEQEYESLIIECEDDYEGRVIATLLSKKLPDSLNGQKAVLYIHGYGDYFFQDHLAQMFLEEGLNFYALDLRKHGRSWLPHQRPCISKSLTEYYEEIDKALLIIKQEGNEKILVNGHSNGGLITSLYADDGKQKGLIDAMVLNSPFLDWPVDPGFERVIYGMAALGRIRPFGQAPTSANPLYGHAIHKDFYGEWDFTTSWKPHKGFPKYLAWATSICDGQDKIAKGLDVDIPVLLLHSDKSYLGVEYNDSILISDAILNVEHIKKLGPGIGKKVEMAEIKDATHDIFLSQEPIRKAAFQKIKVWLSELEDFKLE